MHTDTKRSAVTCYTYFAPGHAWDYGHNDMHGTEWCTQSFLLPLCSALSQILHGLLLFQLEK